MNFVSSEDLSKEDINKILNIADNLTENKSEVSLKEHATLTLFFEKPSTRTRVSFETAIIQLGGVPIYIDAASSQVKRGETISDTAKVLSSYCDFIATRMFKHSDILEMAENSSSPVINALSDLEHPTQALTDVYTIKQHFGNLRDVKIAFMGDIATNTANSLMITAAKLGAWFPYRVFVDNYCRAEYHYQNQGRQRYPSKQFHNTIRVIPMQSYKSNW